MAILLVALCVTSYAIASTEPVARRAGECVAISVAGSNSTRIVNNCDQRVQIGYCSTQRPISGKRCGERANAENPFYTHLTSIESGSSSVIGHPRSALRLAICIGSMRKFTSGQDGNYSCSNEKAEQLAWVSAVRSTKNEACEAARSRVSPSEMTRAPCECESLNQGQAFHCRQALSLPLEEVREREGFVDNIKGWVRKQVTKPNPDDCKSSTCGTAFCVRG
ncbi:hypothetical protein [Noviherbaspirillum agri]